MLRFMKPNKPQEPQQEQERVFNDARQDSGIQGLGQRDQSSEIRSSWISNRSRNSEEWKSDPLKIYEKQNEELWTENQSLKAQLQEYIKAHMNRLKKAQQEKQKMQKETRDRIYELTKKEQQQKDHIRNEYEMRIKKLTDENVRLVNMKQNNDEVLRNLANDLSNQLNEKVGQLNEKVEEAQMSQINLRQKEEENRDLKLELTESKSQNKLNRELMDQTRLRLKNSESSIEQKDQEISRLKVKLSDRGEEIQKNINELRHSENQTENLKFELAEFKSQSEQKLLKAENKIQQKDQIIERLKKQLEDKANEAHTTTQNLNESKRETEKLRHELTDVKKQVDEKQTQIQKKQEKLRRAVDDVENKDREIERLKRLVKQYKDQKNSKEQTIQQENRNIKHKEDSVKDKQQSTTITKQPQQVKGTQGQKGEQNNGKNKKMKNSKPKLEEQHVGECIGHFSMIKKQGKMTFNGKYQAVSIDSQVLQNEEELLRLCGMFAKNKRPKEFKLLFRASDHDFDVKYKEKYCGVAHTVLLVKTEYGKVIGGYTPLKWKILKEKWGWQQQYDTSGESFVFSINNNHKLTLESPTNNRAVIHYNESGPCFCGGIWIQNKSNTENKSLSLHHDLLKYVHPEYKGKDKELRTKFDGSSDSHFRTQQWEVHRVIFEEQP